MEKEWNRSVSEHVEATAPPGSGLCWCDRTRQNIPAHPTGCAASSTEYGIWDLLLLQQSMLRLIAWQQEFESCVI